MRHPPSSMRTAVTRDLMLRRRRRGRIFPMACYSKRPDSERRVIAIARDRGRFASANSSADGGGRRVHPRGASTAGDEGGSIMKNLLLGVAAGFVLAIVL